ncbi:unnamed protein product [Thelazia callipaeda]|uniref:MFS domain-containing protein n=1 Tax=Thelazia callipaeda TaxID=103827 RepID=A0A0N5DCG1_THECL|nr:unnamed protein product [Thelazia callipaeda]
MKKNIEDNKNKDKEGENKRYVPVVDGGWGWVVVVGSFFIHVFADGIVYSFGILLEVIMKEFNASNTKASMIISLLTGLTLGAGPIASAVTNKFGCRVATISGSLIATAGCAASYYATSVEYLMVSVGCVMGMGFGLMYCPAIVIVTMYFERKRAMATGIAVCGAGIGTILFAPLSEELIKAFSWRTVFAVYAAIVSLCSLCGATFRPLTFVAEEDETNNKGLKNYELDDEKTLLSTVVHQRSGGDLSEKNAISKHSETSTENVSHEKSGQISESTGFITVRDVFYTGSMSELPQDERYRSLLSLNAHTHDKKNSLESASMDDEEEKGSKAREILRTIGKMTDISLLVDPIFLLYAVSNLLTSIAFNSPLVFLPSHATNLGCTPSESARIVSAFGRYAL